MGKPTDTQQIRIYLHNNKGGVLDLSYASKHIFCDIPFDNLRQYISRFCKEGTLIKISKGIYLIGDSDATPEERIIKHYTADGRGMVGGKALLYQLGFSDEKPEKIKILTNLTKGNKEIDSFNIELIETKTCFHKYLLAMGISNRVVDIYEDKLRLHNC